MLIFDHWLNRWFVNPQPLSSCYNSFKLIAYFQIHGERAIRDAWCVKWVRGGVGVSHKCMCPVHPCPWPVLPDYTGTTGWVHTMVIIPDHCNTCSTTFDTYTLVMCLSGLCHDHGSWGNILENTGRGKISFSDTVFLGKQFKRLNQKWCNFQ